MSLIDVKVSEPVRQPARSADRNRAELSFAQERLWFLSRLEPQSAAYNLVTVRRLSGPLAVPALQRAFSEIVRRHDALRSTFAEVDGAPVQVIAPCRGLTLSL